MNFTTLSLRLNTSLNTTYDNLNHIWTAKNKLYLGNIRAANDRKLLHEYRIGAVLSVIDTSELNMDPSVVKMWIAAEDDEEFQLHRYFEQANKFIKDNLERTNVLVHCYAGISRSASLVIAFLMKSENMTLAKAIHTVKKQRFFIEPNQGFLKQLEDYEAKLQNRTKPEQQRVVEETCIKKEGILQTSSVGKKLSYLIDMNTSSEKNICINDQMLKSSQRLQSTDQQLKLLENEFGKRSSVSQQPLISDKSNSFFELNSEIQDVISNYKKQKNIEYQWYRSLNRTEPNENGKVLCEKNSMNEGMKRIDIESGSFINLNKIDQGERKMQMSFLNSFNNSKNKQNQKP